MKRQSGRLNIYFAFVVAAHWMQSVAIGTAPERKINITICAFVRNTMPHILEWIEFHRIQGVDKFILYDDDSQDTTRLLEALYRDADPSTDESVVEVYPANPHRYNRPADHSAADHTQIQPYVLDHCKQRSTGRSKWVMMVDVDEFVYSPKPDMTLWKFVQSQANKTEGNSTTKSSDLLSQIYVQAVRYGTKGELMDEKGELHLDPSTGRTRLVTQTGNETRTFRTFLESNPNRAPHPDLDADFEKLHDLICKKTPGEYDCIHALGKSLYKPERCGKAGVHQCDERLMGYSMGVSAKQLRLDHFPFQSREHVSKLIPMIKGVKERVVLRFDRVWFSLLPDSTNKIFITRVTDRIRDLLQRAGG